MNEAVLAHFKVLP